MILRAQAEVGGAFAVKTGAASNTENGVVARGAECGGGSGAATPPAR